MRTFNTQIGEVSTKNWRVNLYCKNVFVTECITNEKLEGNSNLSLLHEGYAMRSAWERF